MGITSVNVKLRNDMIKFYIKVIDYIMKSNTVVFEFKRSLSPRRRSQYIEALVSTKCSISRGGKNKLRVRIASALDLPSLIHKVDELVVLCSLAHSTTGRIYRILGISAAVIISLIATAITGIIPDIARMIMLIAFITSISIISETFKVRVNIKTLNKALSTHKILLNTDGTYAEAFNVVREIIKKILRRGSELTHIDINEILDESLRDKCIAILNILGKGY